MTPIKPVAVSVGLSSVWCIKPIYAKYASCSSALGVIAPSPSSRLRMKGCCLRMTDICSESAAYSSLLFSRSTTMSLSISAKLKPVATAKVGPGVNSDASHQENHQVSHQENHQEPISNRIIEFCSTARSKKEIAAFLGYKDIGNLTRRYIAPLVAEGLLKMTEPDNPTSRNQKYIKT